MEYKTIHGIEINEDQYDYLMDYMEENNLKAISKTEMIKALEL